MPVTFTPAPQQELAPSQEAMADRARFPRYGRYLEDFVPGTVFEHPRGLTIDKGVARSFAAAFLHANPLYLNDEYARAHGFPTSPVCPQLVFNLVLSLGVQNDSEKAMANLGYYNARFLRPVYPGDTLRALLARLTVAPESKPSAQAELIQEALKKLENLGSTVELPMDGVISSHELSNWVRKGLEAEVIKKERTRLGNELLRRQSTKFLRPIAVHLGRCRVQVHQFAFQIKDEQPITGGLKDAAVLSLALRQ